MPLRLFTFVAFVGVGLAFVVGCGSQSSLDSSTPCNRDGDCASGQTCRQPKAPTEKPQVAYNPCMNLTPCSDTAQCGSGLVCGPYTGTTSAAFGCPTMTCQAPCQEGSCPADQVCGSDGVCGYEPCDQAGAPACAEHYRCDPTAAAAVGSPLPVIGSLVADGADPSRETARGCVRKHCDEDGGFVCRELWSCDPPNAMSEPSGCTPDPCAESGKCESDSYICSPTSDGPRPSGTDPHGCVLRNCEEGFQCVYMPGGTTNYAHCDVGAERADTYGCVIAQCDEEPGCAMAYICDPGAMSTDPRGCRIGRCDEPGGAGCADNYVCDPASTPAGSSGCIYVPPASGGTGGGGVGGTGAGGVGALGGGGGTAARGGAGGAGGAGGSGAVGAGGAATGGSSPTGGTGALGGGGTSATSGAAGSGMTGMCVGAN